MLAGIIQHQLATPSNYKQIFYRAYTMVSATETYKYSLQINHIEASLIIEWE
jgi:hypothetical protein